MERPTMIYTAIGVVGLLLLAGGTAYLILRTRDDVDPPATLRVQDWQGAELVEVNDSQVVSYEVRTNQDTYTVNLSEDIFVVDEFGTVRPFENWTYPGSYTTPGLFVPPGRQTIDVTVTAGDQTWNTTLNVSAGTDPIVSGERAYQKIDMLTTDHNGRWCGRDNLGDGGTNHENAAYAMRDLMDTWGFDFVEVQEWDDGDEDLRNVVAYKWGRLFPDEWIVFGGHFDVAALGTPPNGGTTEGATDDTSGSTTVLELAEGFGNRNWDHTIVMGLWACEELGLLGSRKFVENIPENVTVKTAFNYDMVSINWPILGPAGNPYYLDVEMGPDPDTDVIDHPMMAAYLDRTYYDILGYETHPQAPFQPNEGESCSSDHCAFVEQGYPAYNFFSPGGDAFFWQEWHSPTDTLAAMDAKASGHPDGMAAGFRTLVWIAMYLLIFVDSDTTIGINGTG